MSKKVRGGGRLLGDLPKVRQIKLAAVGLAVLAIVITALRLTVFAPETESFSTSDLKNAVQLDNLSTVDYVYHGIAEKHGKIAGVIDTIDYRVKYKAHVRVSFKMSDIQFDKDVDNKVVTAYLPEATLESPVVEEKSFDFLPKGATADLPDVIALCKKDAAADVNKTFIKQQAKTNLEGLVEGLTMPLIDRDGSDEWTLEFKPLSEYEKQKAANKAADTDETGADKADKSSARGANDEGK